MKEESLVRREGDATGPSSGLLALAGWALCAVTPAELGTLSRAIRTLLPEYLDTQATLHGNNPTTPTNERVSESGRWSRLYAC